jgi:hypothetical protein
VLVWIESVCGIMVCVGCFQDFSSLAAHHLPLCPWPLFLVSLLVPCRASIHPRRRRSLQHPTSLLSLARAAVGLLYFT